MADLSRFKSYQVRISFTDRLDPKTLSGEGLPLLPIVDETGTDSRSPFGEELRKNYGQIPYGSPLYTWEVHNKSGYELLYIGQTMLQSVQQRLEGYSVAFKILSQYVNDDSAHVSIRLCSGLAIILQENGGRSRRSIERFPVEQARRIIDDVEALLIYKLQPKHNVHHRSEEKKYWKPFSIERVHIIPHFGPEPRDPFSHILLPEPR
jgi:hypothetical protein